MLQHPRQENIRLSSIASRLRSEGISQNTRDSPSTQLYCCRKRYLPFPCPVTGSMIPCSAISRSKAVHLVGFRSSTLCTSDLPNTISFPKASCNLRTCEAVFAVKSSSMFTFSRVNVHFFRFFKSAADVQYPVMKRMILVQQEIAKEYRCRSGVALTENMDLPQS